MDKKRRRRPAVSVSQLARAMKVKKTLVYRWIRDGRLPAVNCKTMIIKRESAVELLHNWKRSCTPTEAAKFLGICQGSIGYFIRKNIVQTVKVLNLTRVILSSIGPAKEFVGKDVVHPEKKGFARYSFEKRKEMALKTRMSPKAYQLTAVDRQNGGLGMNEAIKINGKAHRWTSEEAKKMSRKGVSARQTLS